jgi:NAD(P)-dependent dehydrogenase (short-subunit alcohol dehydrogenase family)
MSGAVEGRAILVTGAGRGLGRAFAVALAAAGASVLINDIDGELADDAAAEITAQGGNARGHAGSIATWDGARAAVEACIGAHGRIDGLINNAGLIHTGPAWEEAEEDIRALIEVNVLGAMFVGIQAIQAMLAGGGGAVLNITSEAAVGLPGMAAYSATKGAIASLTRAWAIDLADRNVRVNALAPVGFTRMTPAGVAPVSRPAPSIVAPVVVYLMSDLAAGIHGRMLHFNGRSLTPFLPPRKALDTETREGWSVDDIAAACDGPLAAYLLPADGSA